MDNRAHHEPATPTPLSQQAPVPLRLGLHVLVAVLLALSALRAVADPQPDAAWTVAAVLLLAVVYAVGTRSAAVRRSTRAAGLWLGLLLASWLVLLVLTADAIYLAFPWFFLLLRLLPRAAGLVGVGITTGVAVAGFVWHAGTFTAAMVIGPVIGAAVAIATVLGYQALQSESEQRRRLIVDLEATRAELAAAERRAGVLDERERLAREIHDTLAQGLTSIQLLLVAAGRALDPTRDPDRRIDPARAAALVEQGRATAADNLAEARRFVRALGPADLANTSLAPALRRLCATTSQRSGLRVDFHHVGPDVTPGRDVEGALLRIAQTALGNTVRHSGADRADVSLTVMDDTVTLDVVDDGSGFDLGAVGVGASATDPDGGFGLRSMRSRAEEVGGRLGVESAPGRGTAVSVQLALPGPAVATSADRSAQGHADADPDSGTADVR
jgi:signal transduction histidine kinase